MNVKVRAALSVATIYGFFLIFAQFSFVELLRGAGVGTAGERGALGLMALAGVLAGFWMARRGVQVAVVRRALIFGAVAAGLSAVVGKGWALMIFGVVTGVSVGIATVGVATLLPRWCGVMWVALGTGLGYAVCNLPWVFLAAPSGQAWVGAGLALAGCLLLPAGEGDQEKEAVLESTSSRWMVMSAVLMFMALVWLDSAAFFIIQHVQSLKDGTWGGEMLWRNAGLHFAAAMATGWCLRSGKWLGLMVLAWVFLAMAALAVGGETTRHLAGWWYPVGVSIYSTALVAWPGYLSGAPNRKSLTWRAAWVFAVAGWFGSANGIGMAERLTGVPTAFIVVSGLVVIGVVLGSEKKRVGVLLAMLWVLGIWLPKKDRGVENETAVERGHRVYLEEGCIACHSRYVRPGDPEGWGPPSEMEEVLKEAPVTIGNRRQGPDLRNVGARRSAVWLKEHFMDPRLLVKGSAMPRYADLFEDGRGEDLIAWLTSDAGEALVWRMKQSSKWVPTGKADGDGAALFSQHCAVCHGAEGRGDGVLAGKFSKPPANLVDGPFVWTKDAESVARALKWGVPGTDMPGHELLDDAELQSLASWVMGLR